MTPPNQILEALFKADRAALELEQQIIESAPPKALGSVFLAAARDAKGLADRDEAVIRMRRLADLCAQIEGEESIEALLTILDDADPAVRVEAGEALLDVAFDRYAQVARATEQRLSREHSGYALMELPWIIAEIGEPSAGNLIGRFLGSENPNVVAAAIEALASLGDPASIEDLEPLRGDSRVVETDDGEEEMRTTLGALAQETIDQLSEAD